MTTQIDQAATRQRMRDIETLASELMRIHLAPHWRFRWDSAVRRGGQCDGTLLQISMSRHLAPRWSFEEVLETLLHEIAHAQHFGAIRARTSIDRSAHGWEWRGIARSLGSTGERCHSNETATERMRYQLVCPRHGVLRAMQRRPRSFRVCVQCRSALAVQLNPDYGKAPEVLVQGSRAEWLEKQRRAIADAERRHDVLRVARSARRAG